MKKKQLFIFFSIFILLSTTGCDKFSFLEDYFPSLKKNKKEKVVQKENIKSGQNEPVKKETIVSAKPEAPLAKNVLVKMGDWTMTIEEFKEKTKGLKEVLPEYDENDPETKKLVLEELIRQQLLVEAAKKRGIDKKETVVAAIEEFKKTLLVRELAVEIAESIVVTDQEAKTFYDENQELFKEPDQWRIREILVDNEARAKELAVALLQGADFAQVARENSIAETASSGGDTGFVVEFEDPKIQNAVFTLEPGSASNVFKGDKGYYIVKLEEKKQGIMQNFEDVKEELKEGLVAMNQQQAIIDYVETLRSEANIEINEDLLK
ncbi:MAG: peptidyl-prolyl cis-trans isomerase [Candidatus Omnitrophica bacterium]|nr:peptidyl-prolyl cis-trans isomerase [Candidatus Omnitrophota bacterium]